MCADPANFYVAGLAVEVLDGRWRVGRVESFARYPHRVVVRVPDRGTVELIGDSTISARLRPLAGPALCTSCDVRGVAACTSCLVRRDRSDDFYVAGRRVEVLCSGAAEWTSAVVRSLVKSPTAEPMLVVDHSTIGESAVVGEDAIADRVRPVAERHTHAKSLDGLLDRDLQIYGNAYAVRRDDGSLERLDPTRMVVKHATAGSRSHWGESPLKRLAALRQAYSFRWTAEEIAEASGTTRVCKFCESLVRASDAVEMTAHSLGGQFETFHSCNKGACVSFAEEYVRRARSTVAAFERRPGTLAAVRGALMAVEGVTSVTLDEVDECLVAVVVEGGDDRLIAQCLFDEVPPGVALLGELEEEISGHVVRWGRAVDGVPTRHLLAVDEAMRRDDAVALAALDVDPTETRASYFTEAELAAVGAHHSVALRRRLDADLVRAQRLRDDADRLIDSDAWTNNLADE